MRNTALDEANVRLANERARLVSLEADALERTKKEVLSSAQYSGIYTFYTSVTSESVKTAMRDLGAWSRQDPKQTFRIVFNSPGGSVIDGFALFDFIKELQENGHRIETVALGYAASMGGILLQAGDERIMGKNAFMLIHEISSFSAGKFSEMEDELKFIKQLQDKALDILAAKSQLTKAQIRLKWKKLDWWFPAETALELGFVDKIQ